MDLSSRFSGNGNGNGNGNGQAVLEEPVKGNGKAGMEDPGTAAPGISESGEHSKERDEAGKFATGNKGGPGNPYSRHVANLKIWLAEVVDQEGMQTIGRKLKELAEGGNVAASRLLFQYVMPKQVNPDRMNIEEWRLLKEDGDLFAQLPGMMTKPGSELPLMMVRGARPMATERMGTMMCGVLTTPQEKIGDVMAILGGDPRKARDYLDELARKPAEGARQEERMEKKAKVKPVKR